MRLFLKNQISKYLIAFLVLFMLMLGCVHIDSFSFIESIDIVLGNLPLGPIAFKMIFIISVFVFLFVQSNMNLYYIKNYSYFYIRSMSRRHIMNRLVVQMFINLIVYFVVLIIVFLLLLSITSVEITEILTIQFVVSIIKGIGKFFIVSLIQLGLIMILSEDKAFIILFSCLIGYTFLNYFRLNFAMLSAVQQLAVVIIIYFIVSIMGIFILNKIFGGREK